MTAKIVVHGGAGFWRVDIKAALAGVREAASAGSRILLDGGSAVDAVEAAVTVMENDATFNAGKGSSLTLTGTVEMDAAIMNGADLSAGAVALVHRIKNPIHLARLVMEKTDHVLLVGRTAESLAKAYSLDTINPITPKRRRMWLRWRRDPLGAGFSWVKKNPELLKNHPELIKHDTVGAVAIDDDGDFAAAASTGGTTMKLPGRVGDTPQIGSGLYSDNQCGAATATGWGEIAIKLTISKAVCLSMQRGMAASRAAELVVRSASKRLSGDAGVIAIDQRGRLAAVHNSRYLPWAFWATGMRTPKAAPRGKVVAPLR